MAVSPWSCLSLAVCLLVAVSVSSGNVVPQRNAQTIHHRVARQLGDLQEKADAAKQTMRDMASKGAERAHAAAESAHSHIAERVRRSVDTHQGSTGKGHDSRLVSGGAVGGIDRVAYGGSIRYRMDDNGRRRDERWREREEREREREETEREREEDERERERAERRRERYNRQREEYEQ